MTSSSAFYTELIRKVFIQEGLEDSPLLGRALERLPGVPVHTVRDREEIPAEDLHRHSLFVCKPRGRALAPCPGSRGHLCCAYLTLDLYLGCLLDCSYCIMRNYLNFSPLTVYLDPGQAVSRLASLAQANPDRLLRVGTGEVGDSLLLDPLFELSGALIRSLAGLENVALELKTKTGFVDHLLDLEPKGNAVIGFSLNPEEFITAWEGRSSSLSDRLQAARRAAASGYRLSFHFDPIILAPGWEERYRSVFAALRAIPASRVAWISLGALRYTPGLKETLGGQDLLLDEFVPCRDGKYRYLQGVRSAAYRHFARELSALFPAPIYLCMESSAVWRNTFGKLPREITGVSAIFKKARGLSQGGFHERRRICPSRAGSAAGLR